jgi:hypothetical protein
MSGGTEYVTPVASLQVTLSQSLTEQKPPGLSRDRQGLEAQLLFLSFSLLVSGSFNSSVVTTYGRLLAFQVCFWGGMYQRQTPQACAKAPASWETGDWPGGRTIQMGVLTNHLGSITTLYLVHG